MALRPTRRIALFGATGGTGSATVRSFIKRQDFRDSPNELRLLVRSKAKLYRLLPELWSLSNIYIREGQLTDTLTMQDCLRDADTIICAVGKNNNIPGCHVLQDPSESIIDGLRGLKASCAEDWKRPGVILLSSSTWNARFAAQEPSLILRLLKIAFHHPYLDLRLATERLQASPELVSLLLVQPSALVEDEPTGMEISTDSVSPTVSYSDLGEAFVELSMEESYNHLDAVGVSSRGGGGLRKFWLELLLKIVIGLMAGYVPGYWKMKAFLDRI